MYSIFFFVRLKLTKKLKKCQKSGKNLFTMMENESTIINVSEGGRCYESQTKKETIKTRKYDD